MQKEIDILRQNASFTASTTTTPTIDTEPSIIKRRNQNVLRNKKIFHDLKIHRGICATLKCNNNNGIVNTTPTMLPSSDNNTAIKAATTNETATPTRNDCPTTIDSALSAFPTTNESPFSLSIQLTPSPTKTNDFLSSPNPITHRDLSVVLPQESLQDTGDVDKAEALRNIIGHSLVDCFDDKKRGFLQVEWDNGATSWAHWVAVKKDMGKSIVDKYMEDNGLIEDIWRMRDCVPTVSTAHLKDDSNETESEAFLEDGSTTTASIDDVTNVGKIGNTKEANNTPCPTFNHENTTSNKHCVDNMEGFNSKKKHEYFVSHEDFVKNNKCSGISHSDYTIGGGYLEETNPMYCTGGYDLEGGSCAVCGACLVHKGCSIFGETFRPSLSTPLFTCCNRMRLGCDWVLCNGCFMKQSKKPYRSLRSKKIRIA